MVYSRNKSQVVKNQSCHQTYKVFIETILLVDFAENCSIWLIILPQHLGKRLVKI